MINTVIFDLFETLITETHVCPTRAGTLAGVLGFDRAAYKAQWKARRPRVVTGELSFADALTEVSESLAGKADAVTIRNICDQRAREKASAFVCDERIRGLIDELGARRVALGVISNGFNEDVRAWASCELATAFHCSLFSCIEGVAKPNPEIYNRAMDRLAATPEHTIYIGDGGDDELAGAERAGLRAYRAAWFVPVPHQPSRWPELERVEDVLRLVTES